MKEEAGICSHRTTYFLFDGAHVLFGNVGFVHIAIDAARKIGKPGRKAAQLFRVKAAGIHGVDAHQRAELQGVEMRAEGRGEGVLPGRVLIHVLQKVCHADIAGRFAFVEIPLMISWEMGKGACGASAAAANAS